jgi:hypothetical protein
VQCSAVHHPSHQLWVACLESQQKALCEAALVADDVLAVREVFQEGLVSAHYVTHTQLDHGLAEGEWRGRETRREERRMS